MRENKTVGKVIKSRNGEEGKIQVERNLLKGSWDLGIGAQIVSCCTRSHLEYITSTHLSVAAF